METRGRQPTSGGRGDNIRRRLRFGVVGTIAVGGAIFVGGAASLATAFANTGEVTASENCTTWSAAVSLDANVTIDKIVDVVVTPSSLTDGLTGLNIDTTAPPRTPQIWSASGAAPATATFTLNIWNSVGSAGTVRGTLASTAKADIKPASDCTTTPAIATTPVGTPGLVGTSISDVATVTGSGSSPTGTVIFKLFAPSNPNCNSDGTAPVFTSSPVTLMAAAPHVSTATGPSYTTTAPGTYHWVAAYSGDGGETYNPVSSKCADEAVVITNPAPTSVLPITTTPATPGGVLGISTATPSTGAASILNSMTIGVFLLLGGLGSLLVSLMLPRRRRI